jgi:hypothetical protein
MSWFIFAMLSTGATVAQAAAGADSGVLLAGGAAIAFSAVFAASIKHGVGGASRWDFGALGIGIAGLMLWLFSDQPVVAVAAIMIAELAAVALTVAKLLKTPGTETLSTWAVDCIAGMIAIIAVGEVDATHLLYPAHHVVLNGAVVAAILTGHKMKKRSPLLNNENYGSAKLVATHATANGPIL